MDDREKHNRHTYIAIVAFDNASGNRSAMVVEDDDGSPSMSYDVDDFRSFKRGHWLELADWYVLDITCGELIEI